MENETKQTNYFKYFKGIVGWHIYGYIILNFLVGLLDALGLAMFIPLLGIASGSIAKGSEEDKGLGQLQYFIDWIESMGMGMNLKNVLILMIILFTLKGIFYYTRNIYFAKIRLRTIGKLRLQLVDNLNELSYSGFTKMEVGRIQNTMIGELAKLMNAFQSYFNTIQHFIMVVTYISIAALSNWRFAILVAIGGYISNIAYRYINDYTKKKAKELSAKGHDFNDFLVQALQNFKYLKATNYFSTYSKNLTNNIHEQEKLNFQIGKIGAIGDSVREPFIIIIIALVIIIQMSFFETDFKSILASLLMFYRALAHLITLQSSWNGFLANSAGVYSFEQLLKELKFHKEPQNHTDKIEQIDDIEIRNLNLSFGELKVIDDISFNIKKNSSVAFVGESGAGKTTLANIISGLQIPNSGDIVINGKSLYKTQLNAYRQNIGYITQEAVIFNDTVFNNVTFWNEKSDKNMQKFHQVMEKVAMTEFLEKLPKKEDSPLGNNGILISGGQKQRISIARELYKDIGVLVMDEATSALDSETERHIKNSIDLLQGQTTLIIIAHRLSTIKDVDVIHLMDKGKIIASGNFNELYHSSDRFRKMVELQAME